MMITDVQANGYLVGALADATFSLGHNTTRFGQRDREWLVFLQALLAQLGHRAWIYREGRARSFWVLETSAPLERSFHSTRADPSEQLSYARGYFDADGGMPIGRASRLYFQYCQKDRASLEGVHGLLTAHGIPCGRIHNPSIQVAPDYWRFFVRTAGHRRFAELIGSWHPRKIERIRSRFGDRPVLRARAAGSVSREA